MQKGRKRIKESLVSALAVLGVRATLCEKERDLKALLSETKSKVETKE